ncbi:MAG: hypothetical protein KAX44_04825, partial [Candidatus Brocadiae bacterium]|nr:hypothetical protein [Candidatus Brocadiia bacterium]
MPDVPSREEPSLLLSVLAVFLISAGVIALQLALMRCLSIARWHHFSYLVISTALLGFGASGTLLAFVGAWLRRRFTVASTVVTVLFALSVTLSFRVAEALPLDPRYVLYSGRQAALMFLYHVLLLIPFLLAATVIGLSLIHFTGRVHLVYGANLIGSGLGGAVAIGLMFLLPPVRLLHVVAAMGVAAAFLWSLSSRRRRRRGLLVLTVLVAGGAVAAEAVRKPLVLRVDQYKALSIMRQWEAQGDARRVLTRFSPRARLDVYESPAQHHTLFVSLTATSLPPPQLSMLADGDSAGTVFKIRSAEEAEILDFTLMSVPYRLVNKPRVLLLGEAGGMNVWLARRMGAGHVTVVQPNPQIVELMRGPLAEMGGEAFSGPDVQVVVSQPRAFLERSRERFDIVQIVTAEGVAAGVSALRSLHEDFLLTRQG